MTNRISFKLMRGTGRLASIGTLALVLNGCAGKTLSIQSDEPVDVALVALASPGEVTRVVGKTPLAIPLADVAGSGLRLSADGRQSAWWIVTEALGDTNELKVSLPPVPQGKVSDGGAPGAAGAGSLNQILRLTLNAWRALAAQRYDEARQLAEQASKLAPDAAPPLAIQGVALARLGNRDGARASLRKAQSLDPSDADIPALIKTLGIE